MLFGIGPKNNLKENGIKFHKKLPIRHNLWNYPLCLLTGKVSISNSISVFQMDHWNSGLKLAIIHKGNVEGKIPNKEELLNERPDMQLYGKFIEKSFERLGYLKCLISLLSFL